MRIPMFIAVCFIPACIFSQQIGAFSDFDKKFFVFDQGTIRQLEFQPVKSFQVGDRCIGYVNNGNYLKAYGNHLSYDVSSSVSSYQVTNQIICFVVGTQLYAFEDGEKTLLSKFVGNYQANDSIIAFFDTEKRFFLAYYNHQIFQLEDGIIYSDDRLFKVGSNMVAYVDAFQNFKVFYRGKDVNLFKVTESIEVQVGRNVMAFIDQLKGNFQAYYNEEIVNLEQFSPKSYQVGYDKIAYIDQLDNFKVFDQGNVVEISSYAPDTFQLVENILIYSLQGQFYAYTNGESFRVENYMPTDYQVDGSRVAYIDQNGHLSLFENGEKRILSYESIKQYQLTGETVIYTEGVNTVKVYYQQKTYTK